jgi:hypothetical protein
MDLARLPARQIVAAQRKRHNDVMQIPSFGLWSALASLALLGCGGNGGGSSSDATTTGTSGSTSSGGAGGTVTTGGSGAGGSTTASGTAGAGGTGGTGGTATTGSGGTGGSGGGGTVAEGQPCGQSANGAACQSGLVCCYPCGIPDCNFTCTVPCMAGSPGCSDQGCLLVP